VKVQEENNVCNYYLCDPCVTSVRQTWQGNGQRPRPGNNIIRKENYKSFEKC